MKSLLKHPQFAKLARKMARNGRSYREIANELTSKGYSISHNAVGEFLKDVMDSSYKIVAEDEVVEQEALKEILDTRDQLKKINIETWEIVTMLKKKLSNYGPDMDIKAARVILAGLDKVNKQIELQSKISGRITSGAKTINISYLDMSTNMNKYVVNYLKDLEDKGYIQVIKPEKVYTY